jgi:NarL family two-component system response regulator YdfI
VLHPNVAEHLVLPMEKAHRDFDQPMIQSLSPRENEILHLLAAGLGNKEIAWKLKISEHTVKFHVTSILNKLGASNRTEAVAMGVRQDVIWL